MFAHEIIVIIASIIVAIILFIGGLNQQKQSAKDWEKIERSRKFDDIVSDFNTAVCYIDDKLRMGREFLFIKSIYGKIFSYGDIEKIRMIRIGTRAKTYKLMVKLTDGSEKTLCEVQAGAMQLLDSDGITEVIKAILQKNNSIAVCSDWPKYKWIEDIKGGIDS